MLFSVGGCCVFGFAVCFCWACLDCVLNVCCGVVSWFVCCVMCLFFCVDALFAAVSVLFGGGLLLIARLCCLCSLLLFCLMFLFLFFVCVVCC